MRQRSREFFEDLYWITFAVVLLLLMISMAQVASRF